MQRNDVQCEMYFGGGIVIFTGLERLVATSFRRRLFFQISRLHTQRGLVLVTMHIGLTDVAYSYFNLRCRIKASRVRDKTERQYG